MMIYFLLFVVLAFLLHGMRIVYPHLQILTLHASDTPFAHRLIARYMGVGKPAVLLQDDGCAEKNHTDCNY